MAEKEKSPDMAEGETRENAQEESAKTPPSEGEAHSPPVKPAPEEATQPPSAGDTVDETTTGGGRSQDSDKKKRRRQDGGGSTTTSDSGKKRFNLRDEMSEVKTVLEGDGEDGTKCHTLHRRYQSLVREYKRMERRLVECQKKQLEVAQHRDIIQNEYARANLAKSKLENLCRELQKHSKQVAEESRQRAREEEERRKEVSGKFQNTINDITLKMQEHHQRNQALQQENMELASKLKQLAEQYDAREEQFEKILKQRHLEVQLSEAKLAQHTVVAAEEKEISLQERQQLLAESLEQQKRCEQLTKQEMELRGQLSLYSEKFEEFQKTLTRSNEVFGTFKKEMDKMSKTITVLEKEMIMWRSKYEKCNKALIDTAEERLHHERQAHVVRTKNEKLEKLCRALQLERNQLQDQIRKLESEKAVRTEETRETPPKETAMAETAPVEPNTTSDSAATLPHIISHLSPSPSPPHPSQEGDSGQEREEGGGVESTGQPQD